MPNKTLFKQNNRFLKYTHLPLYVALATVFLTACTTLPPYSTVGNNTPSKAPSLIKNSSGNYNYNSVKTSGLLDEESLAELADLLEAKDMTMVENDQKTINKVGDLWNRIRDGYGINRVSTYNSRIEAQKEWFVNNQEHLNRMTARASRYLYYTVSQAENKGIPLEFALLPIIESSYDPSVTSSASAAGLWQFIPSTGRIYGLNQTSGYDGRRDVPESTDAAYDYLKKLYNQFGDWELALAAYNAGPTRVQKAINANRKQGKGTDFWSLSLPTETMNYVPRFIAVSEIVGNPVTHNIYLPAIANKQHFSVIPVSLGVTLNDVANVAGVSLGELQNLNAGILSGRVEANSPQRVIVPHGLKGSQIAKIRALSAGSVTFTTANNQNDILKPFVNNNSSTYVVQPNDTLDSIARRAGISSKQLAQWNNLNPNAILLPNTSLVLYAAQYIQPKNKAKRQYKPSKTSNPRPQYYMVKSGDTLIQTAKKFGLSTKKLASYNNLTSESLLHKGQCLSLIPSKVKSTSTSKKPAHRSVPVSKNKPANSSVPVSKTTAKGTTTRYKVKSGDTLLGIANRHHTTGGTIAVLNGVDIEYRVIAGQYLTVPNSASTSKPFKKRSSPTKSARSATVMSTSINSRSSLYKVRGGDTLTSVANNFGVSLSDLASANGLDRNSQLQQYSRITIPVAACVKKIRNQVAISNITEHHAYPIRSTENYHVKGGDNLTALARKYNVSVPELAKLNHFSTTSDLQIGQVVKVPTVTVKYTVRSGDSLTSLARRYNVSIKDLAGLNCLSNDAMLQIGQIIQVPN